ncbi:MAG: hypothetical protein IKD22_05255, partial [Lentisphaeria bacterium]|nr:hypothetical protein [Lentisphaeria bacterium]
MFGDLFAPFLFQVAHFQASYVFLLTMLYQHLDKITHFVKKATPECKKNSVFPAFYDFFRQSGAKLHKKRRADLKFPPC